VNNMAPRDASKSSGLSWKRGFADGVDEMRDLQPGLSV
jgi:hypothetical protein